MKVLILTTSFGGGHNSVAKAIRRSLEEHFNINAKIINLYEVYNSFLNRLTSKGYVYMMKYFPHLYGFFYNKTHNLEKANSLNMLIIKPGLNTLKELLKKEDPAGVVAVYPTYGGMFYYLKKRGFSIPKTFVVITDFIAHVQWLYDYIDLYFVPTLEMKIHLYKKGIICKKVEVSGIPIQPEFDQFKSLERNLILISAGLYGMTPSIFEIGKVVEETTPEGLEIILLCGEDRRLYQKAKEVFKRIKPLSGILSQTQIAELIGKSYLLISKAGGLTTSEALASETPMIVYKPLPGQEYFNALYLEKNEAGLVANNKEELKRLIKVIFEKRELREKLIQNIKRIKKPNSAYQVAKGIYDELQRED
ncbi:MAG: hypothetical protein N3A56_00100 [Thermodesulfobacteriaceae bacterium]|nr:hypothetical protein [Thermodesulfobacteriaceae bacterium]